VTALFSYIEKDAGEQTLLFMLGYSGI